MIDKVAVDMMWNWETNKITWYTRELDADAWSDSDMYVTHYASDIPGMWMVCENTPEGIAGAKRILVQDWTSRVTEASKQVQNELMALDRAEAAGWTN